MAQERHELEVTITPQGEDFITHYEAFRLDVKGALEAVFQKHFG